MNYKTVKRNSTREQVMKQILKSIESGQLKPGDKLPTEQQLIEMFGVGRSTIREATSTLSMLGYLQSIQGKGCFVARISILSKRPALRCRIYRRPPISSIWWKSERFWNAMRSGWPRAGQIQKILTGFKTPF